jgi:hypothetical protein
VTTGVTDATCTAVPLLTLFVVTTAVKFPAMGFVEKVTVSAVAVAAVTVPTAPLLNTTVLLPGVVLKPEPLIVIVLALAAKLVVATVTTGFKEATCTAEPLLTLLVVTIAVKLPAVGRVEKVTVRDVAVAAVTVPTAPLLNTTVLLPTVVENPNPLITTLFDVSAKLLVELVTTGFTVATCTAEPLLVLFDVTTAVKLPAAVGFVENVTVSEVAVAEVTVPTAPLLKVTEFREAVRSNPDPLIVTVVALAAKFTVLLVTTGITVAICTAAPLLILLVMTVAVKLPATGDVENVTVNDVAEAAVTVPTAPLLRVTVLLPAVESKPNPLIVTVVALPSKLLVLLVTTGITRAT